MRENNHQNQSELYLSQAETELSLPNDSAEEVITNTPEQKDRFLLNPPRQPKKEIADIIETHGILVPKRFSGLSDALEAIKSGKKIIVRSEHPHEYAGASGLMESYVLSAELISARKNFCEVNGTNIDWADFFNHRADYNTRYETMAKIVGSIETTNQADFEHSLKMMNQERINHYCELLSLDANRFIKDASYSYWEKIDGINRSIIADSAVSGRYHIFSKDNIGHYFINYAVIDNGRLVLDKPVAMTDDLKAGIEKDLAFYENIRQVEIFDPQHCPIIEFQTFMGNNYFLQYHRTRNKEESHWLLNRELEEGEFEATFVRGATKPEGLTTDVVIYYPFAKSRTGAETNEKGSFDMQTDDIFSEIASRRRVINFEIKPFDQAIKFIASGHQAKSKLFYPQIAVYIDIDNISPSLLQTLKEKAKTSREPTTTKIRLVSDGRKAFVKLLP